MPVPQNRLLRRGTGAAVRAAPDPLSQFVANVKGFTANRAHQGLQQLRSSPSIPEQIFNAAGIPVTGAREVLGGVQTAISPVGGLGEAVGHAMWPNPGDPRAGRLGDLAEMVTPLPVEKLGAAAKLTGAGVNALLRPRVAATVAKMADEAGPVAQGFSRRGFLGGAAAAGGAAAIAGPAVMKGLMEATPAAADTAKAVAPQINATAAIADSYGHEVAARQWAKVQDQLDRLGYANPKTVDNALAISKQVVEQHDTGPLSDDLTSRLHYIYRDGLVDGNMDANEMAHFHMEAAADARKALGPYANSPLSGTDIESALHYYREDPEQAHMDMEEGEQFGRGPFERSEAGHIANMESILESANVRPSSWMDTPHPIEDWRSGHIDFGDIPKGHSFDHSPQPYEPPPADSPWAYRFKPPSE